MRIEINVIRKMIKFQMMLRQGVYNIIYEMIIWKMNDILVKLLCLKLNYNQIIQLILSNIMFIIRCLTNQIFDI